MSSDVNDKMAVNTAPNSQYTNEYYYEDDVNENPEEIENHYVQNENTNFRSKPKLTDQQLDELVKKVKDKLIQELNLQYAEPEKMYQFASKAGLREQPDTQNIKEVTQPKYENYQRNPELDIKEIKEIPYETSLQREKYVPIVRPLKSKIQNVRESKINTKTTMEDQYYNEPSEGTLIKERFVKNHNQKVISNNNQARIGMPKPIKTDKKLMPLPTKVTEENRIFEQMELKYKNDSYEDYVIPEKDDPYSVEKSPIKVKTTPSIEYKTKSIRRKPKKFASKLVEADNDEIIKITESVTENVKINKQSLKPLPKPIKSTKDDIFESEEKIADYETTLEEKARTESLTYDELAYKNNFDSKPTKSNVNLVKNKDVIRTNNKTNEITTRYGKQGTMIPTREKYRMTTPNYYAQLPRVAEKYNFQEPIPEKDRQPEILRQIGPKPEIINGNIRVR